MAPFPQSEAEAAIAIAFDKPLSALYAKFGPAVAAASIAQVHRAEVESNGDRKTVAVKVLRPGIERRFKSDLDAFYFAARNAEAFSAEARRLRLIEVVSTLARSVAIEMDFRLEAAAASEIAVNTREDGDFRVPTVDWDRTAREVLTLEWIDGIRLSDHVHRAARALARRFDDVLRPLDLTNGQFSLLMSLNRQEPPTLGSVASLLAMDRTTLTANLKPLERRRLLKVSIDKQDRRSRRLALTPIGRTLLIKAYPIWKDTHD